MTTTDNLVTIRTGPPGSILIGAELYRDGPSHLAQVGSDTIDAAPGQRLGLITGTDGRVGAAVHPLTISLHASAIETLDRYPDIERWTLLWYATEGLHDGTLGIAPAGVPRPDALASTWEITEVSYRDGGRTLVLRSRPDLLVETWFNLEEQRFETSLTLLKSGARRLARNSGMADLTDGQRCLLSIQSRDAPALARTLVVSLSSDGMADGERHASGWFDITDGPLSHGHLFLAALREARESGTGPTVRLIAL